jgi:hypothetical protein
MSMASVITGGPYRYKYDPEMHRVITDRWVSLGIRYDEAKLRAVETALKGMPGALQRAVPSALNKTAAEMSTWFFRELQGRLHLKRKDSLRGRISQYPVASGDSWVSGVRLNKARFTVASFASLFRSPYGIFWWNPLRGQVRLIPRGFLQERYTHYQTGKEMDVAQVYRRAAEGEQGYPNVPYPAFMRNRAGHIVKQTRLGEFVQRYSIKVMRGPSIAMVFSRDPTLIAQAESHGSEILDKKIQSQVDRFTAEVPR